MTVRTCDDCKDVKTCFACNQPVESWDHVGVRMANVKDNIFRSGVVHYANPCGHSQKLMPSPEFRSTSSTALAVYKGGPLWQAGFKWRNVFFGNWWTSPAADKLKRQINIATADLEEDPSYSGGLIEYKVGKGVFAGFDVIQEDPPELVPEQFIVDALGLWIATGKISQDVRNMGAYNVFLPPGVTAQLGTDTSCAVFCDYHDSDGRGLNFTVEPYPCSAGCNQCTSSDFDTLTQGLSEEMTELKTDMVPGTGWVIGNEEICDYCDTSSVCNQTTTGEYVNAWYSNAKGKCWTLPAQQPSPPASSRQLRSPASTSGRGRSQSSRPETSSPGSRT